MPNPTYELIATATVASSGSTLVFSSIPQTYKDLILKFKTIYNFADGYRGYAYISTNASATGNWNRSLIFSVDNNGPNISSSSLTNQTTGVYLSGFTGANDDVANYYGNGELIILDYASSLPKSTTWESGEFSGHPSTTNAIGFGGIQIYPTTAISTITMGGSNLAYGLLAGSTASLYGVKAS